MTLFTNRRYEMIAVAAVVLLALLLRSVGHFSAPNGWRDDELSNALVISQHVLQGDVRFYYDDASGHEGLYHWLQALTMALFGPSVWGIRGVSILAGTASVLLTYLLARQLFDVRVALLAALLLAISFWSLMYSRSGQRHILVTVTTLTSFYCFWRAVDLRSLLWFSLAGVALGIGYYTYFASRGVPLIFITWGLYLLIFQRKQFKTLWQGLLLTLGVSAVFAIPLIVTLQQQPEAEARVEELALPVYDALNGDFSTLAQYTLTTASMFTHDGDSEVLYNVAHRPVFAALGGGIFWAGVGYALYCAFAQHRDAKAAFLLLWLGAGLAPGALSVPAASLGHTILAQPVAMIIPAFALITLLDHLPRQQRLVTAVIVVFIGWEVERSIYDYWWRWPADDFNRVLHHSDLHEASRWLNAQEKRDVAIGSFLTERWDQQALSIDLNVDDWRIRAYDPRLVCFHDILIVVPSYLAEEMAACSNIDSLAPDAPYLLAEEGTVLTISDSLIRFNNNIHLTEAALRQTSSQLEIQTRWHVAAPLDLPPRPLYSKPPPPGTDDSPRLMLFIQLLDADEQRIAGVDALGVDVHTLIEGDRFTQMNTIDLTGLAAADYQVVLGLYDPATSTRVLGVSDEQTADNFRLDTIAVGQLQ